MMLYGSRTTVMGIALLATSYWGSKKANLAMVWCGTFVALTDGFVSKRTIDGGEWNHWGFVSSFFLTTSSTQCACSKTAISWRQNKGAARRN
jgi:hypothetical protein